MSKDTKLKCAPSLSEPRRRGRGKGTKTAPDDLLREVWLLVEHVREIESQKLPRKLSVAAACGLIEERGGLVSLVGGNRESVAAAMKTSKGRPRNWRRVSARPTGPEMQFLNDPEGDMIIGHEVRHAETLRTRYVEAKRKMRNEPSDEPSAVRIAWTNMLHDRLGKPRPYPSRPAPSVGRSTLRKPG
jgi:hypothetical protein